MAGVFKFQNRQKRLLRRVQVSCMTEQFRQIGADRKTISHTDRNVPDYKTPAYSTKVDILAAFYNKTHKY